MQGLSDKLRRSLNKGLKQFCITSGSSVIKHTTELKGEEERTEKGKRRKEIPQVELVNSKRGEIMTESRERGQGEREVFALKRQR